MNNYASSSLSDPADKTFCYHSTPRSEFRKIAVYLYFFPGWILNEKFNRIQSRIIFAHKIMWLFWMLFGFLNAISAESQENPATWINFVWIPLSKIEWTLSWIGKFRKVEWARSIFRFCLTNQNVLYSEESSAHTFWHSLVECYSPLRTLIWPHA